VRRLAEIPPLQDFDECSGRLSARMAGEMSGVFDPSLQGTAWASTTGASFAVRILGLLVRRRFDKFWAQEEVWIRKGVEWNSAVCC
jgi:hypothetical protein